MNNIVDFIKFYHNHGIENLYISSSQINSVNYKENNRLKAPYINNIRPENINDSQNILEKDIYGIGFNLKESNLAALDIDGCYDRIFLRNILEILKLPTEYEWIVESGSECGFHIIFQTNFNDEFKKHVSKESSSAFYSKNEHRPFSKLEFLFEGQLILPNSRHESGGIYTFLNNVPTTTPRYVDINNLIILHKIYCDTQTDTSKDKNGHLYKFKYKSITDKKINEIFHFKYRNGAKLLYNVTAIEFLFPNEYLIQVTYFLLDKKHNILLRNIINIIERKDNVNYYINGNSYSEKTINIIGDKKPSITKSAYFQHNSNLNEFLNLFYIENIELITPVFNSIFFEYIFNKYTVIGTFKDSNHKFKHKIIEICELLNFEEIYKSNNPYKILYLIYFQYINKTTKCTISDLFISLESKKNEVFKNIDNFEPTKKNNLDHDEEYERSTNQWPSARDAFDDDEQYNDWLEQ